MESFSENKDVILFMDMLPLLSSVGSGGALVNNDFQLRVSFAWNVIS